MLGDSGRAHNQDGRHQCLETSARSCEAPPPRVVIIYASAINLGVNLGIGFISLVDSVHQAASPASTPGDRHLCPQQLVHRLTESIKPLRQKTDEVAGSSWTPLIAVISGGHSSAHSREI